MISDVHSYRLLRAQRSGVDIVGSQLGLTWSLVYYPFPFRHIPGFSWSLPPGQLGLNTNTIRGLLSYFLLLIFLVYYYLTKIDFFIMVHVSSINQSTRDKHVSKVKSGGKKNTI